MIDEKNRQRLKQLISKNIETFFIENLDRIIANSQERDLANSLKGRYNELKRQSINGTISNSEYMLELNKIRTSLFQLVDQISESSYISNFENKDFGKTLIDLNKSLIKSEEHIKEQGKEIDILNLKLKYLEVELDKTKMKLLERSILSIDTQDANLESYFMSEYINICLKYDASTVKYEINIIVNAALKYSKKYPDLPESEKLSIIEGLNKLNLNIINRKKVEEILENFKLKEN